MSLTDGDCPEVMLGRRLSRSAMADLAKFPGSERTAGNPSPGPLVPLHLFTDRSFVVVGGTGFLGKVWLSLFLHRYPTLGHVYLLVRAKGEQSPEERFWAEIAPSPVFDPLRERYPGPAFEAFMRAKITPVAGDMGLPLVGFDAALVGQLSGKIAALVNVAGIVDFNPPLDEALAANAFGINNLIELARTLDCPVMHTSTCYVAGYRTGYIEEVAPHAVPFPRAAGAPGERLVDPPKELKMDRALDRSHWDPQNEIRECLDVIEHMRLRCEDAFRQSLFLDEAKQNLTTRGEPCRGRVLEDELAKVKRKFIDESLTAAGRERALYWGWPNVYTYTKSIGEQVLAASGLTYTIVRPAVIESSSVFPFVGWNEGVNTSAPFIYMALKGQVQFPNHPDLHIDIIPVDMVCSGMLASLAELVDGTHKPVYQYGCGDVNPCKMARYMELIGLYKRKKLQDGGAEGNRILNAIIARVEPVHLSKTEYERHGAHALARAGRGLASLFTAASIGPAAALFAPLSKALKKAAAQEDKLGDVMDLFLPFVAEGEWVFSCANTRSALARMPVEERAHFYWEPEKIDWRLWMFDVHIPAIERWATPHFEARLRRETKPLRRYETLLDLLDEMAERHDHSVALRMLEEDGLSRITFLEWRAASANVAATLAQAGVKKGDRVLLSGDNRPSWPITYFGILRAGAIAVPVDPKLSTKQLINVARASGAKVAALGSEVVREGGAELEKFIRELRYFDLDALANDASHGAPPDVTVCASDLASIIFTSGTTGDPKGVMLTHENFTALLAALTPVFPLSPKDAVLSVLPLHHTFEFSCGLLLPMSRGAAINYIGELTSERLGEGLSKARISAMVGVPALWQLLERRIVSQAKERGALQSKAFDLALEFNRMLGKRLGLDAGKLFFAPVHDKLGGRVRFLISGGGALPKSTADTFAGLGLHLSEGYGLTEAAPVLSVAKATPKTRAGHVGKPIPGVELKIAEPDASGVGEVLARGPNVMRGYYGDEEATRAAIDADGWLHTGDLGKFDKRDQLVLVGRQKDVIVSTSGENIYPDDVEELLGKVADVEELSVVGLVRGDTEVVACLAVPARASVPARDSVRESSRDAARESSRDAARDAAPSRDLAPRSRAENHARALRSLKTAISKLPRACQPTVVQLYDTDLPKTATRKVKRSEVRAILERLSLAAAAPTSAIDAGSAGTLAIVQQAIAAIGSRPAAEIRSEHSLAADLGFDSLMAMELTIALESRLGRALSPALMQRVETVQDLVLACGASRKSGAVTLTVEDTAAEFEIPDEVARVAKKLLGSAQMGFYDRVMRPKVYGRAFIPHNRNTIVVSNHASHLDMGFVKWALGSYGQDMVALAAADYFFEGKLRRAYFEKLTNLQAFDRGTNVRQALREASDTIRAGTTVLVFPEGTRSPDGAIHEFKATVGHLALTNRVDILPVYLGGTFEAWPKGHALPTRRDIHAHIGPPLRIEELERLTAGTKPSAAGKAVAKLARAAVIALRNGGVLELERSATLEEALGEKREHPLVPLFRELEGRFVRGRVKQPVTFYFTLGAEEECKWTTRVSADSCSITLGKPAGQADCVLKTSPEIFTKMIREAYLPSPLEVMSGLVKTNDVSLLGTFQEAFDLR
ncbi:MAG: AMP-dependent synthetase [Myxococcales bacterium]|nr:AMP-dependent synthetase [Myxococcales bacterium]